MAAAAVSEHSRCCVSLCRASHAVAATAWTECAAAPAPPLQQQQQQPRQWTSVGRLFQLLCESLPLLRGVELLQLLLLLLLSLMPSLEVLLQELIFWLLLLLLLPAAGLLLALLLQQQQVFV